MDRQRSLWRKWHYFCQVCQAVNAWEADPQLLGNLRNRLALGNRHLSFTQLADDLLRLESPLSDPDDLLR